MADSIQATIMDDDKLEDFSEMTRGGEPDSMDLSELIKKCSEAEEKSKKYIDSDRIGGLEARMFKLESQIGRILICLKIARKDEIIVTSEMPSDHEEKMKKAAARAVREGRVK